MSIYVFYRGPFSNFKKCKIVENGIEYTCSEQYFMAMKAKHFQDEDSYKKILESKTGSEAKKLGRKVKNFDKDEWEKVSFDYMYRANYLKFSQNPDLCTILLETVDMEICEASPTDRKWGVGCNEKKALNKKNWNGRNLLGVILMKVRKALEI